MQLVNECRETAEKWTGVLCPKADEMLARNGKQVGGCRPMKASKYNYQVGCQGEEGTVAVDLRLKTCSCRRWQLTGIPCNHALSAIYDAHMDEIEFVDKCYHKTTYEEAYAGIIMPISGKNVWGQTCYIPPLPPNFGRKAGRPAKVRKRGIDEPQKSNSKKPVKGKKQREQHKMKRKQSTIHCSRCGEPGHNIRYCKNVENNVNTRKRKQPQKKGKRVVEEEDLVPEEDAINVGGQSNEMRKR